MKVLGGSNGSLCFLSGWKDRSIGVALLLPHLWPDGCGGRSLAQRSCSKRIVRKQYEQVVAKQMQTLVVPSWFSGEQVH